MPISKHYHVGRQRQSASLGDIQTDPITPVRSPFCCNQSPARASTAASSAAGGLAFEALFTSDRGRKFCLCKPSFSAT